METGSMDVRMFFKMEEEEKSIFSSELDEI